MIQASSPPPYVTTAREDKVICREWKWGAKLVGLARAHSYLAWRVVSLWLVETQILLQEGATIFQCAKKITVLYIGEIFKPDIEKHLGQKDLLLIISSKTSWVLQAQFLILNYSMRAVFLIGIWPRHLPIVEIWQKVNFIENTKKTQSLQISPPRDNCGQRFVSVTSVASMRTQAFYFHLERWRYPARCSVTFPSPHLVILDETKYLGILIYCDY